MANRWSSAILGCVLIVCAIVLVGRTGDGATAPRRVSTVELPAPSAEASVLPGPASPAARETKDAAFAGNVNTHKFHKRGCRYYSCTNCTAKFATREEAIAAGFRPCGTCLP
jgi:hypothetical protein